MRKCTKIWLVTAACLVVIGGAVFAYSMAALHWDFTRLSMVKYETNTHNVEADFSSVTIVTDTADITFLPSETTESSVVCSERSNERHAVTVKDDTLCVELTDTRKWYEHIGFQFGTSSITVYLPQDTYETLSVRASTADVEMPADFQFGSMDIAVSTGDVITRADVTKSMKIKTSTGHITVKNVSAGMLDLCVSTGEVKVTDVTCESFVSSGDTGDVLLQNVVSKEKLTIGRTTGDVRFDGVDAAEISVVTDTGDVAGSLLSDKVFLVQTDTGRIDVPKIVTGGKCEITTDTGNVKIHIQR